ncbi:MAG: hypothetical protein WAM71_09765 [Candidatus Korobacteraceae bacterium]
MAKRLQVILQDSDYREIQRAAKARRMSTAEWVRQSLAAARRQQPEGSLTKKLEALRIASQYQFPVGDIDQMLAEIEAGYLSGQRP